MYLWDLLDRDEYYSPDTQLVWLRDSVRMQAGLNLNKQTRLGIETRYGHDLGQENLWNKLPRGRAIEVLSGIFVFYEKPAVFQTFPLFTPR